MASPPDIFAARATFDPAQDAAAFFAAVPARPCVALLIDAGGRPLQLLSTKNLRALLHRRLDAPDSAEPIASKRVDYRSLVRAVAWQRADGDLEMDLVYIEAARQAFPTHWRQLVPDREAHFVSIDPTHAHPDFTRTSDPTSAPPLRLFGPFPDRAKADRWIELARDAFDLCRYRNVLAQSPRGRACAYKQMNKCPAPCDGTVDLARYRDNVVHAVDTLREPEAAIASVTAEMKEFAQRLEFEAAGKLKTRLTTLSQLTQAASGAVRAIGDFRFISVQPGPRKGSAKVFVADARGVDEVAGIGDIATVPVESLRAMLMSYRPRATDWPADLYLGTLCFHLTSAKTRERFIAADALTPGALALLIAQCAKQRSAADETGTAIRETRLGV